VITGREAHFPSGRALLSGFMDIRPVVGGLGISILTTPKGLMSGSRRAQSENRWRTFCARSGYDCHGIGNKPIPLPQGVKIALKGREVEVQALRASSTWACRTALPSSRKMACARQACHQRIIARCTDWPARSLPHAVHGVTQGFKKDLDIVGVGYRAELKGN